MSTSYDVRVWKIKARYSSKSGKKTATSYGVRWTVAGTEFYRSFKSFAHADSYRSDLVAASRRGEAFDTVSGEPVSWARIVHMSWYEFACDYVE